MFSKLFHSKNAIIVSFKLIKLLNTIFLQMAISFVTVHHLANYRSANLCLQNDPVPFFPGPFILKMKLMRALVNKNNEGSHLIILLCCNHYCWPFEAENNLKLPFDGYCNSRRSTCVSKCVCGA